VKILLDVDAISKLAHWGLLTELPGILGIDIEAYSTVGSLKFRARKSIDAPDGKLFRTSEAAQHALNFIALGTDLPDVAPESLLVYENITGIDPGEALLLAALAQNEGTLLLTGDKRAVKAAAALGCELKSCIYGRVLIVEQIVLAALLTHGIEWLRERICPQRHIDKAISIVMGSECRAERNSLIEGLSSYIKDVDDIDTPSLLAYL